MKKISSRYMTSYKKLFPIFWFGFLVVFLALSLATGDALREGWIFFLVPCFMGIFGFFIMKKFIWNLADEVYDCGDSLLVRFKGREERVYLTNIMNVL